MLRRGAPSRSHPPRPRSARPDRHSALVLPCSVLRPAAADREPPERRRCCRCRCRIRDLRSHRTTVQTSALRGRVRLRRASRTRTHRSIRACVRGPPNGRSRASVRAGCPRWAVAPRSRPRRRRRWQGTPHARPRDRAPPRARSRPREAGSCKRGGRQAQGQPPLHALALGRDLDEPYSALLHEQTAAGSNATRLERPHGRCRASGDPRTEARSPA